MGDCSSELLLTNPGSRSPGAHGHPDLLTDPRILHMCRIQMIMSSRTPTTCNVPADEQCGPSGAPHDREQSGRGGILLDRTDAVEAVTVSYLLSSGPSRSATTGITTKRNR